MARRKSVSKEVELTGEGDGFEAVSTGRNRAQSLRFDGKDEVYHFERHEEDDTLNKESRSRSTGAPADSNASRSMMYRIGAGLLFIGALISLLQSIGFISHDAAIPMQPVEGGAIPQEVRQKRDVAMERRDSSATDWCFKWAQMSAIVNGTLYLYGGQLANTVEETVNSDNTWTNDFVSLDLTKSFQLGGSAYKGLDVPSDAPAVALGYLWSSQDSLWLYGGEFSDASFTPDIPPFSTWQYDIPSGQWTEHSDPVTSSGLSAPDDAVAVQRAAEGAGVNVPTLGRGFYMGGHLDAYTTEGWDVQVPRVYLKSLLEFTFPGFSNEDVNSLSGSSVAGEDGVYRNVTTGGAQSVSFTKRADGILAYIPGFGDQGVLVSLGGGTENTFSAMNVVDVYDIATSSWYIQYTNGEYPEVRVNPCSVVAAAPDGSSYNIYMFGGQDLQPAGSQKQNDDMWILSIPSFIWIKVDQGGQSVPAGRSGATCNIWNAQMIMVGGYLGNPNDNGLSCEYPAIYVFDLSSCVWQTRYSEVPSLDGPVNFMNQQPGQIYNDKSMGGLEGSYGYTVPDIVVSKIGGDKYGAATITKPTVTATGGPFKTGQAIIFSTETAAPGTGATSTNNSTKVAAIVVGVVCGIAFIVIAYLLFCLYVYRKQLALYKRHVEMSQAQARGEKPQEIPGLWQTESTTQYDSDRSKPAPSAHETGSHAGSNNNRSNIGSGVQNSSALPSGTQSARRSSEVSSTEDLLADREPTFVGVMLNPRRSLRVINRD